MNQGRWLLYAALAAALWIGYAHWRDLQREIGAAPHIAAAAQQKTRARETLAAETAKVAATLRQLELALANQEKTDAKNQATIKSQADQLRAAAGPAGRLRDPNAAGCGRGGGGPAAQAAASAGDRAADGADAGGLFSAGATQLFQRLTLRADEINAAYTSCRADAFSVRAAAP